MEDISTDKSPQCSSGDTQGREIKRNAMKVWSVLKNMATDVKYLAETIWNPSKDSKLLSTISGTPEVPI